MAYFPSREAIMNTLFDMLQKATTPDIRTASRKFKMWDQVSPADKPALFLTESPETWPARRQAALKLYYMMAVVWIYVDASDQNTLAITTVNNLLDQICLALLPNPITGTVTLGGLAVDCWIEGQVFKDSGDLDNQALAVVPIKIILS